MRAASTIILNPNAGSAVGMEKFRDEVAKILPGSRVELSEGPGDCGRIIDRALAQGCDTIVAAGGDGTLNGVINAVAEREADVTLGLLPLGTGNDFARTVNIPTDLEHALAVLREGRSHRIDLIKATTATTERYFVNVSAGGFSSKVSEVADTELKETWGPLCYARSVIGALPELDNYETSIILDGSEEITTPAYNIVVANARYVAAGIPIAPTAVVDDGLADLIILPVASLGELAALAPATLLGKHLGSEKIIHRRARRIEVTSTPQMRFNTDGELLPVEPVTFQVLPSYLRFIVGPQPLQDPEPALQTEPLLADEPLSTHGR